MSSRVPFGGTCGVMEPINGTKGLRCIRLRIFELSDPTGRNAGEPNKTTTTNAFPKFNTIFYY